MTKKPYKVILFYKFISIENPLSLLREQRALCGKLGLSGRVLLAKEGINATLEGDSESIDLYMKKMKSDDRFSDIVFKESEGTGNAFSKLEVKVRDEIVTLGVGSFDTKTQTAQELTASELERMYNENDEFVVLDLRNDYEIETGRFSKTVDAGLKNFRDLPRKLDKLESLKNKKVVAVCTGGIRCEKATCLLKEKGFKNIYQLKDGIHTYMQNYPGKNFKGTLFVFDNRMTTDVTTIAKKEIVGRCFDCNSPCETYYNNDKYRPSRKVICCDDCISNHKDDLRSIL